MALNATNSKEMDFVIEEAELKDGVMCSTGSCPTALAIRKGLRIEGWDNARSVKVWEEKVHFQAYPCKDAVAELPWPLILWIDRYDNNKDVQVPFEFSLRVPGFMLP